MILASTCGYHWRCGSLAIARAELESLCQNNQRSFIERLCKEYARRNIDADDTAKGKESVETRKAVIAGYHPFTIQLNYDSGEAGQDLILGVDAGFKTMGVSITGPTKEFYSCEISLLEGQVERNKERRMYRIQRRSCAKNHVVGNGFCNGISGLP